MLKDLAALGLESGGVTLLPYVSSLKNLNIELYFARGDAGNPREMAKDHFS
jgi:hypothetical protein